MLKLRPLIALALVTSFGCAGASDAPDVATETSTVESGAQATPQDAFWSSLEALCGQAFEGHVVESVPADEAFETQTLVMHVRTCTTNEIRVPFFVGDDRSRTWVFTRTDAGLRLKHDHRHEDGSEDEVTQYGGDTQEAGTDTAQEFHADAFTAELLPASATNVWTVEIAAAEMFAYALRREGTERRFRAEFDLQKPIDAPPPPWGG